MFDHRMWIIFLIVFINLLGFGIILPLLPYYVESLGAGVVAIGLLSASYSLFQLISAPILGELSDKFGRRPVLIVSMAGTALSFFIMGFANSLPVLFIARIIDGAVGGSISAAQAYVADITTKENRTQGMAFLTAAFSLGFILGPATGGLLSRYGYGVPALVAAVVSLIATLVTFFFLPESLKPPKILGVIPTAKKRKFVFSFKEFFDVLTHPRVGVVVMISFFMMLAFSLMQSTFAIFSERTLHLSAEDNGFIFAYLGVIGIIIQMFLLKRILKIIPEHRAAVIGIALMSIALALIAWGTSLVTLIIAVTLLALANSVAGPVLTGLISKLSPDDEQGNIMGISQSVGSIARLIGPIIGTLIFAQWGARSPYVLGALVLAGTTVFGFKYLKEPTFVEKAQDFLKHTLQH